MTRRRTKRSAEHRRARPRQPIFWTERAISDLEAIADFIAAEDPAAAERWVTKLIDLAERAATTPLAGRRVPELSRDDLREFLLRSYRIVYRVTSTRCEIVTVFEGHRLFPRDLASGLKR